MSRMVKKKSYEKGATSDIQLSVKRDYFFLCSLNLLLNCTMQIIFLAFQMRIFHLLSKSGHTIQSTVLLYYRYMKIADFGNIYFLLYLQTNQYRRKRGRFPFLVQFKWQSTQLVCTMMCPLFTWVLKCLTVAVNIIKALMSDFRPSLHASYLNFYLSDEIVCNRKKPKQPNQKKPQRNKWKTKPKQKSPWEITLQRCSQFFGTRIT